MGLLRGYLQLEVALVLAGLFAAGVLLLAGGNEFLAFALSILLVCLVLVLLWAASIRR